jgi:hypothetical protein
MQQLSRFKNYEENETGDTFGFGVKFNLSLSVLYSVVLFCVLSTLLSQQKIRARTIGFV